MQKFTIRAHHEKVLWGLFDEVKYDMPNLTEFMKAVAEDPSKVTLRIDDQ